MNSVTWPVASEAFVGSLAISRSLEHAALSITTLIGREAPLYVFGFCLSLNLLPSTRNWPRSLGDSGLGTSMKTPVPPVPQKLLHRVCKTSVPTLSLFGNGATLWSLGSLALGA